MTKEKPKAVLVDIDNTLAVRKKGPGTRGVYDFHRVAEDDVIEPMAQLIRHLYEDYTILIITGRDNTCMEATQYWLDEIARIHYHGLYMKPAGSFEKTVITKARHYIDSIKDRYDVRLVIDDDLDVLKWFKTIDGISVLQPI